MILSGGRNTFSPGCETTLALARPGALERGEHPLQVESKQDDVCKWCAHVLSHLELSVRPSAHLGWTGLDRIQVCFCIWVTLCFMFASCLKLSVRPMDRTGLQFCHLSSQGAGPDHMDGTHWHTLALFVRPSFPGPDRTFKLVNPLGTRRTYTIFVPF